MSSVLEQLGALLARFDDDAYVGLANRGLVRRARKDLEQQAVEVLEQSDGDVLVAFGAHRIRFDHRGPAHARCDCPASGMCQHILAAAMGLQQQTLQATQRTDAPTAQDGAPAADALAPLQAALLALTADELTRHAGKAGYRWAWQYVQDLEPEQALRISGTQHLVLGLQRPRATLRYMGGGVDGLIADTDLPQIEKYRVAAVLAFQRAHGRELSPPAPTSRPRSEALDLGMDHALAQSRHSSLEESRGRFRKALRRFLAESVELGLAHLSPGIQERYATLAVWAQGAEYHRLALLVRRLADHVELLLDRAGAADELGLLDEMTVAHGLVCALDAAADKGAAPRHLVGRARSRYEAAVSMELTGLGAHAWRSPAGYVGLTMIFWSPADRAFMSCTDARPATQRGFNPVARYGAAGPWTGLGAPEQATGRKVVLQGAQVNDAGRLSAADSTSATVKPIDASELMQQLEPWNSWGALLDARVRQRRSLLSEPDPMGDWVTLRPARFGDAKFDEVRQTLVWPLIDLEGRTLHAEVPFDDYSRVAIDRIEHLRSTDLVEGTLLIARLRPSAQGELVAEPLSLVRNDRADRPIDALHFGEPQKSSSLPSKPKRHAPSQDAAMSDPFAAAGSSVRLRDLRHAIQRQSERGVTSESSLRVRTELRQHGARLAEVGLTVFDVVLSDDISVGEGLLRMNYLCVQLERLLERDPKGAVI